jgi:PmbA protein
LQSQDRTGAVQWDLYSQKSWETEILLRGNEIESIRSPLYSQGFAVRIIKPLEEGQSGIGIAPGFSLQDHNEVQRAVKFALEESKITSFPHYDISGESSKGYPNVRTSDPKIISSMGGDSESMDLAEEVVSLISNEKDIKLTFCKVRLTTIESRLENCLGLHLEKKETFCYFEAGLSPISRDLSEYWPRMLTRRIEDLELARNIPEWAKYARDSLKSINPENRTYALIVPPVVLAEMVPSVASFQASASSLKKGYSKWTHRGQKIWSDQISISDDGLLDYGLGTSPFDDEGTPQQRTDLISKGEFKDYVSNRMYSSFVSSESTGNAVKFGRGSGGLYFSGEVGLGDTNTVMEGGDSSQEEMIRETKFGLLMTQFSWMIPDSFTGSFGAEIRQAYFVENGEIKHPVKGGVVNGSFFDTPEEKGVFNSLDLVSREVKMNGSSVLPWVRFPEIRVSGGPA